MLNVKVNTMTKTYSILIYTHKLTLLKKFEIFDFYVNIK